MTSEWYKWKNSIVVQDDIGTDQYIATCTFSFERLEWTIEEIITTVLFSQA